MTEEKRGPGRPKKEATVSVMVMRDYWDANGERHRAGSIEDVAVEDALDGIESGAMKRHKGD